MTPLKRKVLVDVEDLHQMALDLWEYYNLEGEDGVLSTPLEMGLIRQFPLTQDDIDNNIFEDVEDYEVGIECYMCLTADEIFKKLGEKE